MKIHELQLTPAPASKRVGRGIGSGTGKTSGRGTKGQNSRTGGGVRPGFEGGQNPLAKRLPKKRGFKAKSHQTFQVVNLGNLSQFKVGQTIDPTTLVAAGLVKNTRTAIKLLGQGEVSQKLTVTLHAASNSAKAAIASAGGQFSTIELPKTPKLSRSKAEPK